MKLRNLSKEFFLLAIACQIIGCGVRGDPRPPFRSPQIGRGKATFRKVGEELNIKVKKSKKQKEEQNEKL